MQNRQHGVNTTSIPHTSSSRMDFAQQSLLQTPLSLNSLPKDLLDLLREDSVKSGLVTILESLLSACRSDEFHLLILLLYLLA
jgi:hypothetical protein